jgi:cobalt-zinc-cadmium resistance protein CzcA
VLSVEPRLALLSNLGVSPSEVMDAVESGLAGREVGRLYPEGGRWFPVVVRLGDGARNDPEVLKRLPVGVGGADTRPLGDLADIRSVDSYSTVVREQGRRRAAVLVNTRGRDVEGFVREAQERIAASVKLPEGHYLEWGGAFKNLQEARSRLALLTPLALGLVLFMVYAAFRDMRLSLLVFAGVPLALVGGVAALSLRGLPFSISAGVGFIALAGIAVLNGVVLTSGLLDLRRKGVAPGEAVRRAALGRLRPVLMTALVEVFGFLPMMFSTGLGAEVQQPLATVVVGGVISATVLTLLTLPSWQKWTLERELGLRN